MNIALVRVDNRLVHGQIIEAWIPFTKATCLAVVDDNVAEDFFRATVIKMAVPREIDVIVSRVEEFATRYLPKPEKRPTIVLFSNVADVTRAMKSGFNIGKLNIGNLYTEECSLKCSPCVLLSNADIRTLKDWLNSGMQIDVRRVPREKPVNIRELIDVANGESIKR